MSRYLRPLSAPFLILAAVLLAGCIQEFDVPDADSEDGKAFVRRCSLCHALPDPTRMEYPKWQAVVKRMAANIKARSVPPMSEEEKQQILSYLKRTAKPFAPPATAPTPTLGETEPASEQPDRAATTIPAISPAASPEAFKKAGIIPAETNMVAPDFELVATDGGQVRLSDYRGQLVLLNFWATWCGPCVEEMPTLERVAHQLGPQGLTVLAVSLDTGPTTDVAAFAAGYHWRLPILLDPENRSGDRYAVRVMPTTYLIDPAGAIVGRAFGIREWDSPDGVALLKTLLPTV
jgi:peroxiredoxin